MNTHLTTEEVTEKLLGASSLTVNAHLLECPACASELDRLKSSISNFRDTAHAWSEDNIASAASVSFRAQASSKRWLSAGWVLVAAAMIPMVAVSAAYLHRERASRATSAQAAALASIPGAASRGISPSELDDDNQLLSQVSVELSEAVPAPLQPLVVSESDASGSGAKK
jgi:anti-sigma factor RsiW